VHILVLGGAGFVGRHAVEKLLDARASVIIGTRNPGNNAHRLPATATACEQREVRMEALTEAERWPAIIEDVDTVLNCVGILRQRGRSTYDRVHHRAPEALAAACAALGRRLVHVSALGLHEGAGSRFLTSKLAGEGRIRNSGADWIIARPSLLDGEGGFGARWLRGVSRLPFFFDPSHARGRIAALAVEDLGEALTRLCLGTAEELNLLNSREFDLGGLHNHAFRDYVQALRRVHSQSSSLRIPVPGLLARLFAHFCDLVHFTPFSYGHWELLQRDNVPNPNRLPELLERPPTVIGQPDS